MSGSIICFDNVRKSYDGKVVIQDFSLAIEANEFVTIIGSSGCGKTTILKMINGLVQADSGKVYVQGRDIKQEDIVALRRNIGYAIQGNSLFPHMTVRKNIAYVPGLLNKKDREKTNRAVDKWLKALKLGEELLDRYPDELSGGQQQRVGIARALAASPEMLLMDEPFGAVDEITRQQLQDEILRIHKEHKVTVVFITHDIREALKLGTKVLVMEKGQVVQYDEPAVIKEKPASRFVKMLTGSK